MRGQKMGENYFDSGLVTICSDITIFEIFTTINNGK